MITFAGTVKIEGSYEQAAYVVETHEDGSQSITVFRSKHDDLVRKTAPLVGLPVMHAKKLALEPIDLFCSIR